MLFLLRRQLGSPLWQAGALTVVEKATRLLTLAGNNPCSFVVIVERQQVDYPIQQAMTLVVVFVEKANKLSTLAGSGFCCVDKAARILTLASNNPCAFVVIVERRQADYPNYQAMTLGVVVVEKANRLSTLAGRYHCCCCC